MKIYFFNILILLNLFFFKAYALSVEDKLENPNDEKRASEIFLQIRCLVCSGQVIENSDSTFALNLRKEVRSLIKKGLSDNEIKIYLVKNYGEEILMTPSLTSQPLLWLSPLFFLILAFLIIAKKNFKKFNKKTYEY